MLRREFCQRIGVVAASLGIVQTSANHKKEIQPNCDATKWELGPNDVIVLQTPDYLSNEAIDSLAKAIEQTFPGHKVLILEAGMTMEIVKRRE